MKPLPHVYAARLTGGPDGYAVVAASGVPDLRTAAPADFDGPGDAWSPEQFLMAAVESCFLFTLRAVARASKVEFTSLELTGEGIIDRKDGATRFTEIVLRPRLTLRAGESGKSDAGACEKRKSLPGLSVALGAGPLGAGNSFRLIADMRLLQTRSRINRAVIRAFSTSYANAA
jgi:organic hydroperoxide reductase OsmC/OhrA